MQRRSHIRITRERDPAVWQFDWSEKNFEGKRIYQKIVIGNVKKFVSVEAARRVVAVAGLLSESNHRHPKQFLGTVTVGQLCDHFELREMAKDDTWGTVSTKKTYKGYSMLGELAASISHELKQPISAAVMDSQASLRWLNRDQPNLDDARRATAVTVRDKG